MKLLCIICARGGSKGIKNKNLLNIDGKSLLAHSILLAKKIKMFSKIIVSTDSKKIAKEAIKFGADVPFVRPKRLAGSRSPEILSWKHAILFYEKKKIFFDGIISLPSTSPLRKLVDIKNVINKFKKNFFDTVVCVTESPNNPYFNILEKKKNGYYNIVIKLKNYIHNRQQAPKTYNVTTVCFASNCKFVLKSNNLFSGKVGIVKVPFERSIDIDNIIDYKICKFLYEKKI